MTRKPLWRISITTTPEAEDAVAELLGATLKQPASSYLDAKTGKSTVTVYLLPKRRWSDRVHTSISAGLKQIKDCGLNIGSGRVTVSKVRRENWAESWKHHFKPIEIVPGRARHSGRAATTARRGLRVLPDSLLIKPSWSQRRPRLGQAAVVLDPGLGFGTGQHPTTAFCLREIVAAVCDRRNRRSQSAATGGVASGACRSFLDIGTGSGILAVAAAKLGYQPVHAFDFDPEAVRVARANARANGAKVRIRRGDLMQLPLRSPHKYDVICANLIAPLLIAGRRRMINRLHRDGTLVVAGILKSEFPALQKLFAAVGLKLAKSKNEREWRSGSFRFAG